MGVQGLDWVYIFVTGYVGLWLGVRGYVWSYGLTGGCVGFRMGELGSSCMHMIEAIAKRLGLGN